MFWNLVNPGYGPIALNEGVSDIIRSIFADGTDGFYFNFSKTDRLFQEATGPTLADDVGESIGLALDQRLWAGQTLAEVVAAASEVAPALSAWNFNAQAAYIGGEIVITGDGAADFPSSFCSQFATTIGAYYRVEIVLRRGTTATAVAMQVQDSSLATLVSASTSSTSNTSLVLFFRATSATSRIGGYINGVDVTGTAYIVAVSCKLVPGNHGLQATAAARPKYQTGGLARFDGTDDNLLTPLVPGAANSLIAKVAVPATISATQIVIGSTTSLTRLWMGFNSAGNLVAGVGTDGSTTIKGTTDLRGTTQNIALVQTNGGTVQLYVNNAQEYSAAQNGTAGTQPLRVGASNDAGIAANFFAGDAAYALAIKKALSAAEIAAITTLWGTT